VSSDAPEGEAAEDGSSGRCDSRRTERTQRWSRKQACRGRATPAWRGMGRRPGDLEPWRPWRPWRDPQRRDWAWPAVTAHGPPRR